jgi:serine/threonine protein kinase
MKPEHGQRIYAVFEAALKIEPARRAALLANLCAGDAKLRAEVERLLAQDAEAERDRFLATSRTTERDEQRQDRSNDWNSLLHSSQTQEATSADTTIAPNRLPATLASLGDYEIERELGRGGMGIVYLAKNRLMGRYEVLKVMGQQITAHPELLERFLREIRAVANLRHPNIVTAYHAAWIGENVVFAMEYVEGLDLSRVVKARGPLPVAHACSYIHQAALGLQHAYEQGMVHRDIKPSNFMLAQQGNRATIKVLDFGLAKVKSEGTVAGGLTHDCQFLGTPDYVAPEQTIDPRKADIRADIYSLGCTMYCLLAGRPPFQSASLYELMQAHHSRDAMPLNLAHPAVPVEVATIVAKMMAKDPTRRFQTPKEVAQALKPFFKVGSDRAAAGRQGMHQAARSENTLRTANADISTAEPASPGTGTNVSLAKSRRAPSERSSMGARPVAGEKKPVEDVARLGAENTRRFPSWLWPSVGIAALLPLAVLIAARTFGVPKLESQRRIVATREKNNVVDQKGTIQSRKTVRPTAPASGSAPSLTVNGGQRRSYESASPPTPVTGGTLRSTATDNQPSVGPEVKQPGLRPVTQPPSATRPLIAKSEVLANTFEKPAQNRPDGGFEALFNGQNLDGWEHHPRGRPMEWKVDAGAIVCRGPRRGHLYTTRDDFANFHARVDAKIGRESNVCFGFRVPPIVSGELNADGYEVSIDAVGSNGLAVSLIGIGGQSQSRRAVIAPNSWIRLEVIAVGRKIVVKVNEKTTVSYYDVHRKYQRGHFAIHQIGDKTEAQFRALEVRSLDLGNSPAEIATGNQPRSFVAQVLHRKHYVAFTQQLTWVEARQRCTDLGGCLAFPIDEEENRFLTMMAKGARIDGVWLGAYYDDREDQWFFLDNSPAQYRNWDPNAGVPIDLRLRYYPVLVVSRDGKWSYQPNIAEAYRPGYICQWD